jgi:LacI family transcriptional regulator, repressor for deo operon, udp, cdd, tsx, nupC, and nupG
MSRGRHAHALSVRELAEQLGVSVGTVSRALSNRGGVSAATRARVLERAAALGYDRTRLRQPAMQRVAFVCERWDGLPAADPFYSRVLYGAEQECRRHGLTLTFGAVSCGEADDARRRLGAEAFLCVGYASADLVTELAALDLPLVLVDHFDGRHLSVNSDNHGGAVAITEHLIDSGSRTVGFIGGQRNHFSIQERYRGFRDAAASKGITIDRRHVAWADPPDPQNIAPLVRKMVLGARPPEGIFAFNDHVASVASGVCQSLGLRVPDDVAIVGFDDWDASAFVYPPLTTMRVEREEMGAEAIRLLLDSARSGTRGNRVLPVELIERKSSRSHR